ncbi:hypothetical protein VPNG_08123 [Cytospora leucostoma]|uniref:Major facilitator superfamily (MFS) profile domain-containing protein n=1 Tax=Cytospora leucostoma TaxID=1230097 RepID=A0A423WIE4_9PEZI|nr:hypothetical protein VPNG_08123 [Cytospora leucostoma]
MTLLQKLPQAHSPGSPGRARVDRDDADLEPLVTMYGPRDLNNAEPQRKGFSLFCMCIVVWLSVFVFLVQFSCTLFDIPSVDFLQDLICRQFYGIASGELPVTVDCMVADVQDKLGFITKLSLVFSYLPVAFLGILTAILWGAIADRYGRKMVLWFSVSGMVLFQVGWLTSSLGGDMRYHWIAYIFLLLGGGQSVAQAMVFAIICDVTPKSKRAAYLQAQLCAILLAQALARFAAKSLMKHEPSLPMVIAPVFLVTSMTILNALPETLDRNKTKRRTRRRARPTALTFSRRVRRYIAKHLKPQTRWSRLRTSLVSAMRSRKNQEIVHLLPGAATVFPSVIVVMSFTMRYFPIRFAWPLWMADRIPSMYAGSNLLVLLVHIPVMSFALYRETSRLRDLILSRLAIICLFVGQIILSFGQDMRTAMFGQTLLMLGSCLPSFCRAALSRNVAHTSLGKLAGLVATCELLNYLFWGLGDSMAFQCFLDSGLDSDGKLTQRALVFLSVIFCTPAIFYASWGMSIWGVKLMGQDANVERLHPDDSDGEPLQDMRQLFEGRVTTHHASLVNPAMAF